MALPAFWVTTLAKVLSGDQPCPLQPWLSGRMKFPKRNAGRMAKWQADHTELLDETCKVLAADESQRVSKEQFFSVEGSTAKLSGKADLIVQPKVIGDVRPKIIDVKTGQPRDSDVMQVIIEIVMVPLSWGRRVIFDGGLIYRDHESVAITHAEAEAVAPKIFATLKRLGTEPRPEPLPSKSGCQFCDVPESECAVRWQEESAARTELF